MKTGPKPKPRAIRLIEGNPGRRPIARDEMQPDRGAPPMPAFIAENEVARAEWERIVPALEKLGVLTVVDGAVLEAYCMTYAHFRLHEEALKPFNDSKGGHVYTARRCDGSAYIKALPQVSLLIGYERLLLSLMGELGLSPSMRTRIVAGPPAGEKESNDRLRTFFAKKREREDE